MASPQYRHAHQLEKERWRPIVDAGEAYCTEIRCLKRTRWIPPGTPWDLAHDRTNGGYLGPAHARCNRSEGATHGNKLRARRRHQPTKRPANRWTLRGRGGSKVEDRGARTAAVLLALSPRFFRPVWR